MTDYRHQRWDDEIEEQAQENRERFWREQAEADEYWRRVAAGEIKPGEDDNGEREAEDRREDRSPVQGVPGDSGGLERGPRDATPDVENDGRMRPPHAVDGGVVDSPRTDGDMPAERGGDR